MAGAGTIPKFAWPATIDSTNDVIRFEEWDPTADGGAGAWEAGDADITDGDHFWRGDGTANDLAARLQAALIAASPNTATYSVILPSTGIIRIAMTQKATAENFRLVWGTGDASSVLYGFIGGTDTASTSGGFATLYSDHQVGNVWLPEQVYVDDSENVPQYRSTRTVMLNGRQRVQRWGSGRTLRRVLVDILPPNKVFQAEESRTQESFQRFYAWVAAGGRFEFAPDWTATPAAWATYVINDDAWLEEWPATIPHGTIRRYNIELPLRSYVA